VQVNASAEQHCSQLLTLTLFFLVKNTPTEVSTADPLKQYKKSSSLNLLWKSTYYSFCPEILLAQIFYLPIILKIMLA